jgi:hypothetical protein
LLKTEQKWNCPLLLMDSSIVLMLSSRTSLQDPRWTLHTFIVLIELIPSGKYLSWYPLVSKRRMSGSLFYVRRLAEEKLSFTYLFYRGWRQCYSNFFLNNSILENNTENLPPHFCSDSFVAGFPPQLLLCPCLISSLFSLSSPYCCHHSSFLKLLFWILLLASWSACLFGGFEFFSCLFTFFSKFFSFFVQVEFWQLLNRSAFACRRHTMLSIQMAEEEDDDITWTPLIEVKRKKRMKGVQASTKYI